jgi:hypothetical protein
VKKSGYVPCACRDCTDVVVGFRFITMCTACDDADCQPLSSFHDRDSWQNECQRPDAYGMSQA